MGIARRALLVIDALEPRAISRVGSKPAPLARGAALPPAVAVAVAAVVGPVPARAGFQAVSSFDEVRGVDGPTAVVTGTGAASGTGGQGHGDLGGGDKEAGELHGDGSEKM